MTTVQPRSSSGIQQQFTHDTEATLHNKLRTFPLNSIHDFHGQRRHLRDDTTLNVSRHRLILFRLFALLSRGFLLVLFGSFSALSQELIDIALVPAAVAARAPCHVLLAKRSPRTSGTLWFFPWRPPFLRNSSSELLSVLARSPLTCSNLSQRVNYQGIQSLLCACRSPPSGACRSCEGWLFCHRRFFGLSQRCSRLMLY